MLNSQTTKMNIWIIFSLLVVAFADSNEEESRNVKDFEAFNSHKGFGRRPIFPFDAFGLGFDHIFSRPQPPFMAAMNTFNPSTKSSEMSSDKEHSNSSSESSDTKSESKSGSTSNEKHDVHSKENSAIDKETYYKGIPSVTIETSEISSLQIESVSQTTSSFSEKDVIETISESRDISSGDSVFASSSYEKIESEGETASVSNRGENDKSKSTHVSSDERRFDSSSKSKEKESDPESSVEPIYEDTVYVNSESISISEPLSTESDSGKSSFSTSSTMSTKSDSKSSASESSQTLEHASTNSDRILCDEEQCFADSLAAYEPHSSEYESVEMDREFLEMGRGITIDDIRQQLKDGYYSLERLRKRIFKKELVTGDLTQIIMDLENLCDKICQDLPAKYLASNLQF